MPTVSLASMASVVDLVLNHPSQYAVRLEGAKHAIYAFGGVFLLQIFLDWVFEAREVKWLRRLETVLERAGAVKQLSVVLSDHAAGSGQRGR